MGWESDALGWDGEVYNLIFNFLKRWKTQFRVQDSDNNNMHVLRYTLYQCLPWIDLS